MFQHFTARYTKSAYQLACEGKGKGKDERVKRGRIALLNFGPFPPLLAVLNVGISDLFLFLVFLP